ncbi:MAG: prepilin-type N-terminal cleavage/methylation domain-containing protein [Phycisphaerae bacterium]|nr:prepilin-type N-terminal cleavage/methylation domain-containing protein [Phycisphaerae bacterium]
MVNGKTAPTAYGLQPTAFSRPGFTLIEVILAIALAVGLLATIMAFHRQAGYVRNVIADDMAASAAQRILMDRWSDDLEGALPYSFLQMGLEGTINPDTDLPELRFVTATLPGPSIWAVRKTTDDPIPPEHDLQMVIYQLSSFRCADDHVHVTGLQRSVRKIITPTEIRHDGKDVSPSMFIPQVKFLDIQYYDGGEWFGAWPMPEWDSRDPRRRNLPTAVKVIVGREECPPDMKPDDYPLSYPTFQRTIFLTGGTMSLDKTIIRRPGMVTR